MTVLNFLINKKPGLTREAVKDFLLKFLYSRSYYELSPGIEPLYFLHDSMHVVSFVVKQLILKELKPKERVWKDRFVDRMLKDLESTGPSEVDFFLVDELETVRLLFPGVDVEEEIARSDCLRI